MGLMIRSFLKNQFQLNVQTQRPLSGYSTQNTLVATSNSQCYVIKEYNLQSTEIEWLEEESRIINILADKYPLQFPRSIPNQNGKHTGKARIKSKETAIRVLEYLEGNFLTDQSPCKSLIESFGDFLAKMDLELLKTKSIPLQARISEWDIQHLNKFETRSKYVKNPHIRKLTDYFNAQFKEVVMPLLPQLRKSIIHGDANDGNVLVNNKKVTGIIDFGDICHSYLVNELAIAITYVMFNNENPLQSGSWLVQAYNKVLPLKKNEIEILYYLIGARLAMSLWNSSWYKNGNENEHIEASESGATQLLIQWAAISPIFVTNTFLKAAGFPPNKPPKAEKSIQNRNKHISKSLSISYREPIQMEKAAFQYMFDSSGKTYLDMCNNIPHVGHCHPQVVHAGQKQMALLNTNTRYLYDVLHSYSEKLIKKFPKQLNKVFFVNSGSAANDLAIRMARNHTQKHDLMIMEHGYHGNTQIGIEISSYKFDGKGGKGKANHIVMAPIPDLLRGKYQDDKKPEDKYVKDVIQMIAGHGNPIAAFIAEPIIGCGGQIPLPPNYLSSIYKEIRNQGGICISDEVQTGFGRLGDVFWGFEQQKVIPDIVVIGKPMGNGHPMGAVITTDEIAKSFETGMEFFSSFGGNPVSCAIGNAVLDVMENENLQMNATLTGNHLKDALSKLKRKFPIIGDIRGSGLFLGIEMVTNKTTMNPGTALATKIQEGLKQEGILVGTDGPFNNVLKIKPPLCFDKENADQFIHQLTLVLKDLE